MEFDGETPVAARPLRSGLTAEVRLLPVRQNVLARAVAGHDDREPVLAAARGQGGRGVVRTRRTRTRGDQPTRVRARATRTGVVSVQLLCHSPQSKRAPHFIVSTLSRVSLPLSIARPPQAEAQARPPQAEAQARPPQAEAQARPPQAEVCRLALARVYSTTTSEFFPPYGSETPSGLPASSNQRAPPSLTNLYW